MKTQKKIYEQERKNIADANALFMELRTSEDPITDEELRQNIKKNPSLWGRFKNFLPENSPLFGKMNCPVCESNKLKLDEDFPDTMRNCLDCGSEWVIDSDNSFFDITYNSREK